MELLDVVAKQPTGLKLKQHNFIPIESSEGIQFSLTPISNFNPGSQVHTFFITFMHHPPKQQVINHNI